MHYGQSSGEAKNAKEETNIGAIGTGL